MGNNKGALMKMLALLALALPLSAWSADYSRCNFPFEVQVDAEGKVTPSPWMEASNIVTEGNRTTMTVKPKQQQSGNIIFAGEPKRIVVERDEQGRITSITSGGERPSAKTILQYRQMQNYPGGYVSGVQGGFGGGGISLGANYNAGGFGLGFLVPVRRNGSTEMVKPEQLSDADLQQIGIRNITASQLQNGAKEHARDARTQTALRQLQTYSQTNYPFNIPVGSSHQYTFVDGACMPDKLSNMSYSSATDRVESQTYYDREDCQHVKTGWERHSSKVEECRAYDNNQIAIEYNRLVADGHIPEMQGGYVGGMVGGMQGGYVGGGFGGAVNSQGSSTSGGSGSGFGGGYMSYNPYMTSMWGGSPRENLERNYQMCQMYERSWNNLYQGASQGSSFGGGGAVSY
jgi:hypothetical protein